MLTELPPQIPPPFYQRQLTLDELWRCLRLALARNPFYIVSAALLLLSMRMLSGNSRIFSEESPQLFFNFSSFQIYELLLVGTAVVLARRAIWYDAGLLVGVETLFVFVPFILVSQALLLENWIALAFCLAGCGLVVVRVRALKRWLHDLNMPPALLGMGAVLLVINLALPVLARRLHEHLTIPAWDLRGATLLSAEWNLLLPAALGLALLLPSSPGRVTNGSTLETAFFSRRSFPVMAFLTWIAGTAAHVYCIGYVYGLDWSCSRVMPLVWMVTWVLWRQREELEFVPARIREAVSTLLFAAPLTVAFLASGIGDWKQACWMGILNAAVYGMIAEGRGSRLALHLGLVSGAMALCSTPRALVFAIFAYALVCVMFSRRVRWGVLGGIGLTSAIVAAFSNSTGCAYAAMQVGLIFVLLHSLRWMDTQSRHARAMRNCAAIAWIWHGAVWLLMDPASAELGTFLLGLSVVVIYFCARAVVGIWGSRIVPYAGVVVMSIGPAWKAAIWLLESPAGVLVLIGSFVLFAAGTALAITKQRWMGSLPR